MLCFLNIIAFYRNNKNQNIKIKKYKFKIKYEI